MQSMQVILALDIGSSSARCSAYRILDSSTSSSSTTVEALDGCSSQRKIRSVQPNTGKIILNGTDGGESYNLLDEIDASIDSTLEALRELFADEQFQVVAVGFSTFVMNLIGVDENGIPVGEEATLSYACNSPQVAEECRNLKRKLGEDRLKHLYQKTGAPLHSAYALPQLRVLYSGSTIASQIHQWQSLAGLCLARWQGLPCVPISYSEASWTGLLNFTTCEWEQDALDLLPDACRDALPCLSDYSDSPATIPQYLDDKPNPYWERWSELRETSLFLGVGDGACANIGSKCVSSLRIAVTVGTSAAARVCLPLQCSKYESNNNFHVPPGLFCYRINRSHVLVGGALTDGGSVVEWATSLLNLNTDNAFRDCMREVEMLMQEDIESPSLMIVPFLSGERSTGFRDGATGCAVGLTRETTPARFMKACLEGVMLRIKAILRLVELAIQECRDDDNNEKPYVIVSGNAMEKNGTWRQMLADASGMETLMDSAFTEGTSRGVARLVAMALGIKQKGEESSDALMSEESISSPIVSRPRKEATKGYWTNAAEIQDCFIDAVTPLW